ncbi:signal peptide protein [Kitasatospora sp. NBC_01300]|uniref:signal peptide protein n=1 Tax=Kitasatospora sp. NBC_01300 TaxID=2903574 RepID=UPI002F912417|nr:signal peptide protein [Kitasatospora sp. NBC_01300]
MPTWKVLRRALAPTALAAVLAMPFTMPSPALATGAFAPQVVTAVAPVSFVGLPDRPLPSDHSAHPITVTYRNDSSADRTVAPQILVESPDDGPFLAPTDIKLEVLSGGHWKTVRLASETGTLYTDLTRAKLVLHSHHTLTQRYRLTVVNAGPGTVQPRIALYS